jgi:hypothetical protein
MNIDQPRADDQSSSINNAGPDRLQPRADRRDPVVLDQDIGDRVETGPRINDMTAPQEQALLAHW